MTVRTIELIEELSDNYADRLDDDQRDLVDELLEDESYPEAVLRTVECLADNRSLVTDDEYSELEQLCENYGIDPSVLDDLDVA